MTGRSGDPRMARSFTKAAVLLVLLLAFAVRVYDLDGQSMWSDEGLSLYRARQPLAEMGANIITVDGVDTRDNNPLLYFLLLHGWRALAGESIFALRFIGAAVSTLAVPLLARLGRRALGGRVGWGAALLLAISPFHVWEAQELRNYGLLLTLNLVSVYGLYRFIESPKVATRPAAWLALWAGASLLAVYTHYFGFFVLAFGLLTLVTALAWRVWQRGGGVRWRLSGRRAALWFVGGCLGLLLVLLPIAPVALARFRSGQQVDFYFVPSQDIVAHALSAYSVGVSPTVLQPLWRVAPVVLLAVLGCLAALRSGRRLAVVFLLGYQVIPLACLMLLSTINPLYNGVRHLLIGLPPFLLFTAAGSLWPGRGRWLSLVLGGLILVSQVEWLDAQFTDPALIRDDVRGAATFLNQVARPDDLIVLHDTLIGFTFGYYYRGDAPWLAIPSYSEFRIEEAEKAMTAAASTARRVWFLTEPTPRTQFPRQALIQWADEHWLPFYSHRFPSLWLGVNLRGYIPQSVLTALPPTAVPLDVIWEDELRLRGIELPATAVSGQPWWPVFYWSKANPATRLYTLSLRLVDEQGQLWAQMDEPLTADFAPPTWPAGAIVPHHLSVVMPAGIPPGVYQVQARLVKTDEYQTLTTAGGVDVSLGSVAMQAATCQADTAVWPSHTPLPARLGRELELRGFSLPSADQRPGLILPVDLFWCVRRTSTVDYQVRLQLVGSANQVVAEALVPLGPADYPSTGWRPGELLRSPAALLVPAQTPGGDYTVRLSLLDASRHETLPVRRGWWLFGRAFLELGRMSVVEWPLVTERPPIQTPLQATFGRPPLAELQGYELSHNEVTAGESLTLTLFWQAHSTTSTNYVVFVHLLHANGDFVGQGDGVPAGGLRPTTSWRPGEIISDTHVIPVTSLTQPGPYPLYIGLYDPLTDQRIPIIMDGVEQPGGRLLLKTLFARGALPFR